MKLGLSKERGGWEKSQVEIFPQKVFVLLRSNFHHLTILLSGIILSWAIPGNLTLNFGIRSTNHPATAMEQQKATCLLKCHCSQCDGERLSDSKKCLSPQISWAPSKRNVPCFASPVLTHCLSFEADLPLSLSTGRLYLHLVLLNFCSSLMGTSLLTLYSVQSGLTPGSLSQESGAEAWDTCDFQETPLLPVFFPTWAHHICISYLTSPFFLFYFLFYITFYLPNFHLAVLTETYSTDS